MVLQPVYQSQSGVKVHALDGKTVYSQMIIWEYFAYIKEVVWAMFIVVPD